MAKEPTTLHDIAKTLDISIGTVHRALHNNPGVSPKTKAKVLEAAKNLGYRPNLAARFLSSRKTLRVSVNTLQGTTSFWDEVRTGISEEAASHPLENIELEFRTYPHIGVGEEEAFEIALKEKVNGIIIFPSDPAALRPYIRRASRAHIPVVCVTTDAPDSERQGIVAIDTLVSGSIAADLMGRFLAGREGVVAITVFDMAITEHAEKSAAFESTLRSLYPQLQVLKPVEDHGTEAEAYSKARQLFEQRSNLAGVYVTTEASMPVLKAASDTKALSNLTIITTDLFPDMVPQIRSGAVAATIYQRPRTQGTMAFRMLHEFLVSGERSADQVRLAPHVVMRGNLDFFLDRQAAKETLPQLREQPPRAGERFGVDSGEV
jgi:LacI family transcriptional regulator